MARKRGELGLAGRRAGVFAGMEAAVWGRDPPGAAWPRGVSVGVAFRRVDGADDPAARAVVRPPEVLVADPEQRDAAVQELREDRVVPRLEKARDFTSLLVSLAHPSCARRARRLNVDIVARDVRVLFLIWF